MFRHMRHRKRGRIAPPPSLTVELARRRCRRDLPAETGTYADGAVLVGERSTSRQRGPTVPEGALVTHGHGELAVARARTHADAIAPVHAAHARGHGGHRAAHRAEAINALVLDLE